MCDIVEKAYEIINEEPEMCWYRWFGALYRESDCFTRLDKTFLYCIYTYRNEPRYVKIIGYPEKLMSTSGSEERITYTTDTVFRVTSGRRSGRIYPADRLEEGEDAVVAGIHKKLQYADEPDKLHPAREHDKFMIRLLQDIVKGNVHETNGIKHPEFYLCSNYDKPKELYLRPYQEAVKYLTGFADYDPSENPDTNLKRLANEISVYAGKNAKGDERRGFPFRYVYGRGVKAADPEINGQWFKCPFEQCAMDKRFIKFNFIL